MLILFRKLVLPNLHSVNPSYPLTPGEDSTTLLMTVSISGNQVYESTVTHTLDTIASNDPQNFSGDIVMMDIDLSTGDTFSISLSAEHSRGYFARVQWGGFETNAGGIIMTGKVYEPSANIRVDSSRRAH